MTEFPLYALDVANTRLAYTVTLNGFPIDDSPGDANGHFSSTRVGEYIADGQNIVSVHLSAPEPTDKFLSSIAVTIRATGNPQVFYYRWDPGDPKHPLPFTTDKHFTTHLPTGPWAWQTAPKITLDAPTKAAINAHLKRLFDALNTKNVDEATALFAPRNREDSAIDGTSAADSDAASHTDWMSRFAVPGWRMDPIDYAHLRYTLEADGRAVLVLRADGSDVLRTTSALNGEGGSYDLYLSLIHGQWTLIR